MDYSKLLKKSGKTAKTVLVHCLQFGDTGKGKFVDFITSVWACIIVRATGGSNAGHTTCVNGKTSTNHLVPSGIVGDAEGKATVIGSGTAINPPDLTNELKILDLNKQSYNNLRIAYNAHLTTPAEIVMDRVLEVRAGKGKIGSTGKGIAQTYSDFIGRQGLILGDIINPNVFNVKLKRQLDYYRQILEGFDPELIAQIMNQESLGSGFYHSRPYMFDHEAIYEQYLVYGRELKPMISDTDAYIRSELGKSNILIEGSQGDLLDIEFGTYPFVTSSSCTVPGMARGCGLDMRDVDLSLGIFKGPIMSRVGCGPFVTEIGGEESDLWCNGGKANREMEERLYPDVTVNDSNEFRQGLAIRRIGKEYGATTTRPRRVGWLDLPSLRYSLELRFNSKNTIMTKVDVSNELKEINVCTQYEYQGPDYSFGDNRVLRYGARLNVAYPREEILRYCKPIYTTFPGWECSLEGCKTYDSLPQKLRQIIDPIIIMTSMNLRAISIGPDREETIIL